jgi:hypothetical protein
MICVPSCNVCKVLKLQQIMFTSAHCHISMPWSMCSTKERKNMTRGKYNSVTSIDELQKQLTTWSRLMSEILMAANHAQLAAWFWWFLTWFTLPPKLRALTEIYGVTAQKTVLYRIRFDSRNSRMCNSTPTTEFINEEVHESLFGTVLYPFRQGVDT